jgi:hypothetical protein
MKTQKLNFLQLIKEKKEKEQRRHLASLCSAGHYVSGVKK